jgi:acetyl esterase
VAELHPQLRELADVPALSPVDDPAELAAIRADYVVAAQRLGGPVEDVARTADVDIPRPDGSALGARAYWPARAGAPVGALVWLHGGGWYVGDLDGFDRVSRSLCNAARAVVLSIDYRLAPEHRFPAAVHDADLAVAWATGDGAAQLGHDAGRVAIGGDSAGGNLAAVAARHAPDALRAQLLVYPVVDAAMDTASFRELAEFPLLTAAAVAFCWSTYLGEAGAPDDPDGSPLRAERLGGLPEAYVAVAGFDVLRDEGVAYARALEAARVPVTLRRYDDMAHGFLRWGGAVDRGRELVSELGAFARRTLRD